MSHIKFYNKYKLKICMNEIKFYFLIFKLAFFNKTRLKLVAENF